MCRKKVDNAPAPHCNDNRAGKRLPTLGVDHLSEIRSTSALEWVVGARLGGFRTPRGRQRRRILWVDIARSADGRVGRTWRRRHRVGLRRLQSSELALDET